MNAQRPAIALRQHLKIAPSLRRLHDAERTVLPWHRNDLLIDDAEPAQPFSVVGIGPKRRVPRPQPLHFVAGFPIFERGRKWLRQFIDHCFEVASLACFSTAASSSSNALAKSFTPSSVS